MMAARWALGLAIALTTVLSPASEATAAPRRVVSMNVCTDQLAMLIAAPGQLLSVSFLAGDPGASALAGEAARYRRNHGLAEEIFLMQPDLVLAGTFTTRATVSMLRRLGFPVEEFAPESSFDDVRVNMRRMGVLLGQEARAEALVADLDRRLAGLQRPGSARLTVATYTANSFTAGSGSLTDAVIAAAGLENLGSRLGIQGAGRLPLEKLVMESPEIVTAGTRQQGALAMAQQNFVHPAYEAVRRASAAATVPESHWICGGPFTAEAAAILRDAADDRPVNRP